MIKHYFKMPTVAQKLCDDIVDPIYTPESCNQSKIYENLDNKLKNDEQVISKMTSSVLTKKIKIIGKKDLSNMKASSKSCLTKSCISSGVNTFISGPLRRDNKCLTKVRARDNQFVCKKCGHRKIFEMNDKACNQFVESVSCGTQYLDKSRSLQQNSLNMSIHKYDQYKMKKVKPLEKDTDSKVSHILSPNVIEKFTPEITNIYKPRNVKYSSPKRWALARYQGTGPDF